MFFFRQNNFTALLSHYFSEKRSKISTFMPVFTEIIDDKSYKINNLTTNISLDVIFKLLIAHLNHYVLFLVVQYRFKW
jgi:hypothetical protein